MTNSRSMWNRLGAIVCLTELAPSSSLGRTALMKYLYFLYVLRNVPVDYDFRLYTYGPFDADVLVDLSYAESLKAVKSELIIHSGGYRYEIKPGSKAEEIKKRASSFLGQYDGDFRWVIDNFGTHSAKDLELESTITYAYMEVVARGQELAIEELANRVHEIKPHFDRETVRRRTKELLEQDLLRSQS